MLWCIKWQVTNVSKAQHSSKTSVTVYQSTRRKKKKDWCTSADTFPYDLTRHVFCKYCKLNVSWRNPTNAKRQKRLQTEANWGQTVDRQLASNTGLLRTDRCLVKPRARKSCYILKQTRRWYDNTKMNLLTYGGQVGTWFALPTILTSGWLLLRWQEI
jgi:hypothetical protein